MKNIIILFLFLNTLSLMAQPAVREAKCDNTWLTGYATNSTDSRFGCSKTSFLPNYQSQRIFSNIGFLETSSSISDSLGNLLFYTNGVQIADKNGLIMQGSDTLNPGFFHLLTGQVAMVIVIYKVL